MKTVAIIGSTGSIGTQALDVLANLPEFKIVALAANKSDQLMLEQIAKHRPKFVTLQDKKARERLKANLSFSETKVVEDNEPLSKIIMEANADITLISLVGAAGLLPTINAAKLGKRVALANKEALVIGGDLVLETCKKYGTELIPVDSEHSAIFQCLLGQDIKAIKKIILTASGGPFLNTDKEVMEKATVEEALNHPNWKMGGKITIDSATMMNKGLEVIEAHFLFDIPYEKIEILIHPQSIVHSLVEYNDGALLAQIGIPDMRVPIQLAFTYPLRKERQESISLIGKKLDFYEPDLAKFGCLRVAFESGKAGKDRTIVLNAANEVAVEHFLLKKISFGSIYRIVRDTLEQYPEHNANSLEEKLLVDKEVRELVRKDLNTRRWG